MALRNGDQTYGRRLCINSTFYLLSTLHKTFKVDHQKKLFNSYMNLERILSQTKTTWPNRTLMHSIFPMWCVFLDVILELFPLKHINFTVNICDTIVNRPNPHLQKILVKSTYVNWRLSCKVVFVMIYSWKLNRAWNAISSPAGRRLCHTSCECA